MKRLTKKRSIATRTLRWEFILLFFFSPLSSAHSKFHWVEQTIPYFNSFYSHLLSFCFSLMLAKSIELLNIIIWDSIWFRLICSLLDWLKKREKERGGCLPLIFVSHLYGVCSLRDKDEVITYHMFSSSFDVFLSLVHFPLISSFSSSVSKLSHA